MRVWQAKDKAAAVAGDTMRFYRRSNPIRRLNPHAASWNLTAAEWDATDWTLGSRSDNEAWGKIVEVLSRHGMDPGTAANIAAEIVEMLL